MWCLGGVKSSRLEVIRLTLRLTSGGTAPDAALQGEAGLVTVNVPLSLPPNSVLRSDRPIRNT
jgi:hypothetical protein